MWAKVAVSVARYAVALVTGLVLLLFIPVPVLRSASAQAVLAVALYAGIGAVVAAFIAGARRGWAVGLAFASLLVILGDLVLIRIGYVIVGPGPEIWWRAAGVWWQHLGIAGILVMIAALPFGAIGGYVGGRLSAAIGARRMRRRAA